MRYLTFLAAAALLALCGCGPAASGFHFLDSTAPIVGIGSPGNGTQIHGATTVSFFAFDSESKVSWVEVTVNGSDIYSSPANGDVSTSASFTPNSSGDFTITVIGDSEGGQSSTSVVVHYEPF